MELPQQCLKNGTSDSMSSMFTLQGSKLYMSRDTWGGIIKHNRSEYDGLIPWSWLQDINWLVLMQGSVDLNQREQSTAPETHSHCA